MTCNSGGFEKPPVSTPFCPALRQDFDDAQKLLGPLLSGLASADRCGETPSPRELSAALERAFLRMQAQDAPSALTESILKARAELRMHILGVALSGASRRDRGELLMLDVSSSETAVGDAPSMGAISHLAGKVVAARICHSMVILLPQEPAALATDGVATGLLQAFDLTPADADWVVDFSGLKELPVSLLGSLAGYTLALRRTNRRLKLVFVEENVLPESALPQFIEFFNLVKRGPYLFSRGD